MPRLEIASDLSASYHITLIDDAGRTVLTVPLPSESNAAFEQLLQCDDATIFEAVAAWTDAACEWPGTVREIISALIYGLMAAMLARHGGGEAVTRLLNEVSRSLGGSDIHLTASGSAALSDG